MTTIAVPTSVIFEKEEDLPNGTYCNGGPVGKTVQPMVIHTKHGFTTQQMHDAVLELCLERAADTAYVRTSGPTKSETKSVPMERTAPDTMSMKVMGTTISNQIIVKSISYKGGDLAINQQTMVQEGEGYECKVISITTTTHDSFCEIL